MIMRYPCSETIPSRIVHARRVPLLCSAYFRQVRGFRGTSWLLWLAGVWCSLGADFGGAVEPYIGGVPESPLYIYYSVKLMSLKHHRRRRLAMAKAGLAIRRLSLSS
jgi:hypothetical protein